MVSLSPVRAVTTAILHLRRRQNHPAAANMSVPAVGTLSGLPSVSISLVWTVRLRWSLRLDNISKKEYYENTRGDDVFDIEFYRLPNGTAPVEEFLDSLNVKMRSKAIYSLSILEEQGNRLREPFSKSLGEGLFELHIKFASDITRIFYFFVVDNKIVLTNGFVK